MQYYTSGNNAYDLSKFEHEPKKNTVQLKKPMKHANKHNAALILAFKLIGVMVLIVAIIALMLYNRAQITALNEEVNSYTRELVELESENTRLTAEINQKSSLKNIEEYAVQVLGLSKLEKEQIVYVNMCEGDKIVVKDPNPGFNPGDILKLVASALGTIKQ